MTIADLVPSRSRGGIGRLRRSDPGFLGWELIVRNPQSAVGRQVKRQYRVTDKERFQQVRQAGASFAHPLLVLCVLPNEQPVSRCGFTVSRRVGGAVLRNRARRRMREAVRLLWDLLQPGWDMVWIARPAINEAEFSELQSACVQLLQRARVLL